MMKIDALKLRDSIAVMMPKNHHNHALSLMHHLTDVLMVKLPLMDGLKPMHHLTDVLRLKLRQKDALKQKLHPKDESMLLLCYHCNCRSLYYD